MLESKLPAGVYFKHGAFYRVIRGQWIRLGSTLEEVHAAMPGAETRTATPREVVLQVLKTKLPMVRQNAGKRGIHFGLVRDDLPVLLARSAGRCAVTGARFTPEIIKGRRPFSPSIDRIDSDGGYTLENCRIVCLAANLAMNVWGAGVLGAMRRRKPKSIRQVLEN